MANLIEGLQEAITNSRELLAIYIGLGQPGVFGAIMIKQDIIVAEKAIAENDCVGMLTLLKKLRAHK